MDFNGKKISVVGLGKSGRSIVRILLACGAEVFVSDSMPEQELLACLSGLDMEKISYESDGNTSKIYEGTDLIVLSPGVPVGHPQIAAAKNNGVSVIGEIELAYYFSRAPIIGVTGTNGKSTTVSLIHKVFSDNGVSSLLAGNIGTPLSGEVIEHQDVSWIVAEISSFQLETIEKFRPKIGVVTHITPDHMDRHGSMQSYVSAKARLFENQSAGDYAVFNFDCSYCREIASSVKSEVYYFSTVSEVPRGYFVRDGFVFRKNAAVAEKCFPLERIALKGVHNLQNVLALLNVAELAGVNCHDVMISVDTFTALHHRMEFSGRVGSVSFYDDSKGTNPGAVIAAMNSISQPFVMIAGGKDKNSDFSEMCRVMALRAKSVVLIGESSEKIAVEIRKHGFENIHFCGYDFELAMKTAYEACLPAGNVLLSPACASFDMFKSAEHRGDEFKRIVSGMERVGK